MKSPGPWPGMVVVVMMLVTAGSPGGASAAAVPPAPPMAHRFTIDASAPVPPPETGWFQMGSAGAARSPAGHRLSIDNRCLRIDGQPWFPVMGEFHYSRFPAAGWEDEILKMKAGGVQVVATYVFWIHHEEEEGRFDWSGRRDLRRFVELCGKHGLRVWARIGPWAHGEARNGGLPDWLLAKGPTRVSDPVYLRYVARFYDEIGRQLRGLRWKDGGPVVGIQLENEYNNRAPNAGAAHITQLAALAQQAGLDVPVYTVTGWDHTVYPPHIVTPVFGGYPDEPWAGSRTELPPDTQGVYQFAPTGGNTGILQGAATSAAGVDLSHYPRFTAELGAGMQVTYHRRVVADAADIPPIAITALGSGVSLLGYYMFHGGTNPDGRLTTLQESQATGYPNDVPVKSYDFQAPLGEFGQLRPSYRRLKVIHQFVADFGRELAPMVRVLPDVLPAGMRDTTTLRVAARTDGARGFLFFNNYVRHYPMPAQACVQVVLKLASGTITVPRRPVAVPSQCAFFWPVNLDLDGAQLTYATAQPFARLADADGECCFFVQTAGIASEFVFAAEGVADLQAPNGTVTREDGRWIVSALVPSTDGAVELHTTAGRRVRIVLLSPAQAEDAWKLNLGDRERIVLTRADAFADDTTLHLRSPDVQAFEFSVFPDLPQVATSAPLARTGRDGLFTAYRAAVAARSLTATVEQLRAPGPAAPVRLGDAATWRGRSVARAPEEAAFGAAGVWRITVPPAAWRDVHDLVLTIRYAGDVARLKTGDRLLDDDFYTGLPWEIGLKEMAAAGGTTPLCLEILPLRADAPIYLPKNAWPDFHGRTELAELRGVELQPEYEVTLRLEPGEVEPAAVR